MSNSRPPIVVKKKSILEHKINVYDEVAVTNEMNNKIQAVVSKSYPLNMRLSNIRILLTGIGNLREFFFFLSFSLLICLFRSRYFVGNNCMVLDSKVSWQLEYVDVLLPYLFCCEHVGNLLASIDRTKHYFRR